MNPVEMDLLKECSFLEKEIKKRAFRLDQLSSSLSWGDMKKNRPKRYSVDISLPIPARATILNPEDRTENLESLQPQVESFVIDGGTNFYCNSVDSSVRFTGATRIATTVGGGVGTVYAQGQPATITLGYGVASPDAGSAQCVRNNMLGFDWEIRDTGSDREWSNVPQPDVFLASGRLGPSDLPIFGRMKGGSEIEVKISPFMISLGNGVFFADTLNNVPGIEDIIVQVSFHGYERIL